VGYDAGKKTKGIKRNALVDTVGLLLGIEVIPARVQDRDCAADLIAKTRRLFPFITKVFADGGYAGPRLEADLATSPVVLEIVKRTDKEAGFKVVRRRWVIERTFSWLRRNRRLMAHYEALAIIAEGFAKLAMICVMLKKADRGKASNRLVNF
jgi:transposase